MLTDCQTAILNASASRLLISHVSVFSFRDESHAWCKWLVWTSPVALAPLVRAVLEGGVADDLDDGLRRCISAEPKFVRRSTAQSSVRRIPPLIGFNLSHAAAKEDFVNPSRLDLGRYFVWTIGHKFENTGTSAKVARAVSSSFALGISRIAEALCKSFHQHAGIRIESGRHLQYV